MVINHLLNGMILQVTQIQVPARQPPQKIYRQRIVPQPQKTFSAAPDSRDYEHVE